MRARQYAASIEYAEPLTPFGEYNVTLDDGTVVTVSAEDLRRARENYAEAKRYEKHVNAFHRRPWGGTLDVVPPWERWRR